MPALIDTSSDFSKPDYGYIVLFGPPEGGKSVSAARVSRYFPTERLKMNGAQLKGLPTVVLEDYLHATIDKGAGTGLRAMGLDVPTLNIRAMAAKYGWLMVPDYFNEEVRKYKEKYPNLKYLGEDTISTLDDELKTWWYNNLPKSAGGKEDTQQMWQGLTNTHARYRSKLLDACDANGLEPPFFLSHAMSKSKGQGDRAKMAQLKMEAQNIEEGDMVPRMTGQNAAPYVDNSDFVIWVDYETPMTGPTAGLASARTYHYYSEKPGVYIKNRYRMLFGSKWEADLGATLDVVGRRGGPAMPASTT
jgi:hypothetical protein